ncbi:MAG: peptidoglycan-binding protein [Rhodocyclales bacterium GT-UBC]|nr:MAG: peptidoglycan-binding protein [Rhodocyclales bacterium GT-UBC]
MISRAMLVLIPLIAACSGPMRMGSESGASTVGTGAAAGAAASNENRQLEKCSASLGTVALVENQSSGWYGTLTGQYKLPPSAVLLKLLVQQSNCFVVVERSAAGMRAMSRERELESSGEMRAGSNFGKGQVVASDYALSPEIIFAQNNSSGIGSTLGGIIGGSAGRVVSSVGANTRSNEASAILTLVDNRSGVQIGAAEGSASNIDWGGVGSLFGARAGGSVSAYSNTPQGKVVAAAFFDAYNQLVRGLKSYRAQQVEGGLGKGGRLKVSE